MKRQLITVALVLSLAFLMPLGFASAQGQSNKSGVNVPVSGTIDGGGKFVGTFNIQRFAAQNGGVVAIGTITGTAYDSGGNVVRQGLQTVALPVAFTGGQVATSPSSDSSGNSAKFVKTSFDRSEGITYLGAAANTTAAAATAAQASCEILRLSIGAIDLNLLGLVVHLNPILLVITAQPSGGLLGQLLCSIANLLNGGPLNQILGQLVNLLNQLLGALGNL